jgi:alkylated DNA repair dioxygenase AlkB
MQPGLFDFDDTVIGTAPDGLLYVPDFLNAAEQSTLLRQVRELDYEHDVFRGQRLKRAYAQFGYAYVSTGRTLEPAPAMPAFLSELIAKGLRHCPAEARFNQCIVTRYPEGAGIGWHTDAPRFGECIMAVSLGGEGRLQFRQNGSEAVSSEVFTTSGSLYVLHGAARWRYQHQVVPVESVRYSLTFREVGSATAGGGAGQ